MQIKNQLINPKIFYFLLAFCLLSLPFPDYSLNTKGMIGLTIYWLFFFNSWKEKVNLLRQHFIFFLVISSFFWMSLVGMLYTNDISGALNELQKKAPFILFPLILFSTPHSQNSPRIFLMNSYTMGICAASLLALTKIWYFKWNNLGEYFTYAKFSEFLNRHTTYYALLIVVSLLWILWAYINKKNNRYVLVVVGLVLGYILYLLSVRASIIALTGGIVIILNSLKINKWKKIVGLLFIPILMVMIYLTPNFQNRFELSATDSASISDIEYRKLHWTSVLETIQNQSILFGKGTHGSREFLYEKYRDYGLSAAYKLKYNAHNQFLETLLDFGVFGLLVFMGSMVYCTYFFIKHKDFYALGTLTVFIIFMINESIFQRTIGVVLFSLLISFFIKENVKKQHVKKLPEDQNYLSQLK